MTKRLTLSLLSDHNGRNRSLDVFTKWRGDGYKMAALYDEMLKNYISNQKGE